MIKAGVAIMVFSVPFGLIAPLLGSSIATWVMVAILMIPILGMLVSSFKYLARL
jgi:hypothetical protein